MKKFKFEDKYHGARCNVTGLYPVTIVGYDKNLKLVRVAYSFGQYDRREALVPEKLITIEPSNPPTKA